MKDEKITKYNCVSNNKQLRGRHEDVKYGLKKTQNGGRTGKMYIFQNML